MPEELNKALRQGANDLMETPIKSEQKPGGRGYQIYTTSQILNSSARSKDGDWLTSSLENAYFFISPEDRIRIAQLCTPVLGIVTSRMKRISGTKFKVTNDKKEEDKIFNYLKDLYQVYKEFQKTQDIQYVIARAKIAAEIKTKLPDVLPDLTNFQTALLRWRKSIQHLKVEKCDEIWDWLQEPNSQDDFQQFIQKWVFDLHIHGSAAIYKEMLNGNVENIYTLAGGTIIPTRDKFTTSKVAYVQLVNNEEPQIFFPDEVVYTTYIPNSARSHGLVPLEALMNKIAESMLFDKLSANMSDMTKMPEKMILIHDNSPFGGAEGDLKDIVPIAVSEQKRLEKKLNTPVQGGIITFSGNNATVIDLSRENLMDYYNTRQKDIRQDCALVFNMSNSEINMTGSDGTSGRETSETQQEIEQGKGVTPILKMFETAFNRSILPFRFGCGYMLEAELTQNPLEEIQILTAKINSGVYSVNELRINEMNENPFEGDEFEKPRGTVTPNGTQQNPLMTQQVQ